LGDKANFYAACPEFTRYFFTPNPTYSYAAISQLGYPSGTQPDEEEDINDGESDVEAFFLFVLFLVCCLSMVAVANYFSEIYQRVNITFLII
jgi:hypothetical protein